MIQASEIQQRATQHGVKDTQIEKDYVIGWLLKSFGHNSYLKKHLVFKGGTVLKKVWFADYRFSEDVDFTFIEGDFDSSILEQNINEALVWVYDESRIKIENQAEETKSETQYKSNFTYTGPLGGEKSIKCDICTDEKICFPTELQPILDSYSDEDETVQIKAYSKLEVLSEKLRCIIQRRIPRDLYDIWYLTEIDDIDIQDASFYFEEKAQHKDLNPLKIEEIMEKNKKTLAGDWKNSLGDQIKELPEFETVWRDVKRSIKSMLELIK